MLEARRSLVVVGCISVGFIISAGPGLVARAAEPDSWFQNVAVSTSTTPEQDAQHRIAELEQRIRELEAERGAQQVGSRSWEPAAAIARSGTLATRKRSLALENEELAQSTFVSPDPAGSAKQPPSDVDPRAQLRYWAKQLRDGDDSRKLSSEWTAAIKVLVRRDRELDPQNPWR